jgi:hypothetical protein
MKINLIDDYKSFYKKFSVWFFIVIGVAPDFYNAVMSSGLLDQAPAPLIWIIRSLSMAGLFSRLIKQKQGENNESNTNDKTIH